MIPLVSLLTGPLGKYVAYAAAGVALAGAVAFWFHEHDARVRAELVASQQVARIAAMEADAARINVALTQAQTEAEARAVVIAPARKAIANAPASNACAQSPAIAAAISGLRTHAAGH